MVLTDKIHYVYHYDELTWMPDIISRPFNEVNLPYYSRSMFVNWINSYVESKIYIWPGNITPNHHQSNWGHLISPSEHVSFLIFDSDSDQTRYSLEFIGSDNKIHIKTHKNGIDAYHSRKR